MSEEPSQTELSTLVNGVTVILATLNSCLNPILYAFLKPQMRMELWKLVTRKKRTEQFIFSPCVPQTRDSLAQKKLLSTKSVTASGNGSVCQTKTTVPTTMAVNYEL